MSRIVAREKAFLLVFEYVFKQEKNQLTYDSITKEGALTEDDLKYLRGVYDGVAEKYDELIACVSKYAEGFRLERIFKIDLSILLLAIYELKYMADIPLSVTCNEAVNLARAYSTDKSPSYINGILANVINKEGVKKNELL